MGGGWRTARVPGPEKSGSGPGSMPQFGWPLGGPSAPPGLASTPSSAQMPFPTFPQAGRQGGAGGIKSPDVGGRAILAMHIEVTGLCFLLRN